VHIQTSSREPKLHTPVTRRIDTIDLDLVAIVVNMLPITTRLVLALVSAAVALARTTTATAITATANATIENIQYKAWLRGGDTQNMYGEPLNYKGLAFLQAYDAKGNGVYSVVRHTPLLPHLALSLRCASASVYTYTTSTQRPTHLYICVIVLRCSDHVAFAAWAVAGVNAQTLTWVCISAGSC
jgi:hypothetical protein